MSGNDFKLTIIYNSLQDNELYYDDSLLYVSYHYYFGFFLPNSYQLKIFKIGIHIICIIISSSINSYSVRKYLVGNFSFEWIIFYINASQQCIVLLFVIYFYSLEHFKSGLMNFWC